MSTVTIEWRIMMITLIEIMMIIIMQMMMMMIIITLQNKERTYQGAKA